MPKNTIDTWPFPDGATWHRDPDTGAFMLDTFKDLGKPVPSLQRQDLADWVGAHWLFENVGYVMYPGEFAFSPVTGLELPKKKAKPVEAWMPPYGNSPSQACQGLRQTPLDLALRGRQVNEEQDSHIPVPPQGANQFMVGGFSTHAALLLAINPRKGRLYAYLSAARRWEEVTKTDKPLPPSSLNHPEWGMVQPDPEGRRLFLPTDKGLAALVLNPLSLCYERQLIPGRCLGAPAYWNGRIVVPCLDTTGSGGLLSTSPDGQGPQQWLACEAVAKSGPFRLPLVESNHYVLWLGQSGQVKLEFDDDGNPATQFIPWPEDYAPCFEFGSPYQYQGELWQLCYNQKYSEFVYVKLGFPNPEKNKASPGFSSGSRLFRQKSEIQGLPWSKREKELHPVNKADETLIPLLEAGKHTVFCVEFKWPHSYQELFSEGLDDSTYDPPKFGLIGDRGWVPFFTHRMRKPWLAQPFVYDGHLYLYYGEAHDSIPGWKLEQSIE